MPKDLLIKQEILIAFVEFFDLTPLSRGGYTHQEDEQRVNEVVISKKTKQINKKVV